MNLYMLIGIVFSIVMWTGLAVLSREEFFEYLKSNAASYRTGFNDDILAEFAGFCFLFPLLVLFTAFVYPLVIAVFGLHFFLMWLSKPEPKPKSQPTLDELREMYPDDERNYRT